MNKKNVFYKATLLACISLGFLAVPGFAQTTDRVHFQDVVSKAKALSSEAFREPGKDLPESLKKIGYDEWRDIRFKSSQSLWLKEPFSVQFFHLGFIYPDPVVIHYVDRSGSHRVPFLTDMFEYANATHKDQLKTDVGFAGFRVHYPLNTPAYADELVSFLGASYFRALGRDLAYGISARGLAVDTAESTGEEFPRFKEFWIIQPLPGAKSITFYALLDSKSVAGAYEFTVRPGDETVMDVKSELFIRKKIKKLGIAPLTSMFFYGKNSGFKGDSDFRPEVHDSDGLLIKAKSGEWIWHPLINPEAMTINAFGGGQPEGFGLLQRDTKFDHYQDLEARYDRRPSVWVTPKNDWGTGHLELLQLPTESEYNDNIGAYWVPERSFEPGESLKYSYSLAWYSGQKKRSTLAQIESTRIVRKPDGVMFIIDFLSDNLALPLLKQEPRSDILVYNDYKVTGSQIIKNNITNGWRLVIHVAIDKEGRWKDMLPNQKPAVELRAFLKDNDTPITETWSYTYQP
jgi:glucans biosynthesis protein